MRCRLVSHISQVEALNDIFAFFYVSGTQISTTQHWRDKMLLWLELAIEEGDKCE